MLKYSYNYDRIRKMEREFKMKLINKDELIAKEIRYDIFFSHAKEGDKLPSERKLSEKYGVQRATIRLALQRLEREGIIEVRQRSGYYIRPKRVDEDLREVLSLSEKIKGLGKNIQNKLLGFERIEVDKKLSQEVKLPIGTKLLRITRLRYIVDDKSHTPISLDDAYIPENIAPKLFEYDLENRSLFEILKKEYNVIPYKDSQRITIVYANERESKLLNISQLTPLVKKQGMIYDKDGRLVQYLYSIKNKEWTSFKQTNMIIYRKIGGFVD